MPFSVARPDRRLMSSGRHPMKRARPRGAFVHRARRQHAPQRELTRAGERGRRIVVVAIGIAVVAGLDVVNVAIASI
jgi:hypothetical protein